MDMIGVIFGTLWYMLEEMNNEDNDIKFNVLKVSIDEEKQEGTAVIRKTIKNRRGQEDTVWHWVADIDIWERDGQE